MHHMAYKELNALNNKRYDSPKSTRLSAFISNHYYVDTLLCSTNTTRVRQREHPILVIREM